MQPRSGGNATGSLGAPRSPMPDASVLVAPKSWLDIIDARAMLASICAASGQLNMGSEPDWLGSKSFFPKKEFTCNSVIDEEDMFGGGVRSTRAGRSPV